MKELKKYITETIGAEIDIKVLPQKKHGMLPMFLSEIYQLSEVRMFNHIYILAERRNSDELSILQTEKHFKIINETLNVKVVLLAKNLPSFNRKRLIGKGINFIVPGKQLFLPAILIDLNETITQNRKMGKKETLLPSAQVIILYRILQKNKSQNIGELSFKQLAGILHYTPMVITNAVNNLKYHEICTTIGEKEKYIRFNLEIPEMWNDLEKRNLLVNPVFKKVFTDEKPSGVKMVHSNFSALPDYSDMNPGRQEFYALDKSAFYNLKKNDKLANLNEHEGDFCLELWKYDPVVIADQLRVGNAVVDPISLYLSLKNSADERIQDALERIIEKYIW